MAGIEAPSRALERRLTTKAVLVAAIVAVAVPGVLSFVLVMARILWVGDTMMSRLYEGQFCTVFDITASPNVFHPTECVVYPRIPEGESGESAILATVDHGILVMVTGDTSRPDLRKATPDSRELDHRPVGVHFVSGKLSGRDGSIERHKLEIRPSR